MKISYILVQFTTLVMYFYTITGKRVTFSGIGNKVHGEELPLLNSLIDLSVLDKVKIHDEDSHKPTKQDIIDKYKGTGIGKCYDAMRNHTRYLNKGHHRLMQLYSFKDLGDPGSYDGCKELSDVATYNYLNMNITKLPVDIRLGVCLPKECTQEMMDKAQDPISGTISTWAYFIGKVLKIGFVVKYHVGFVISFIQPEHWFEKQSDEKTIGAAVVISIIAFS